MFFFRAGSDFSEYRRVKPDKGGAAGAGGGGGTSDHAKIVAVLLAACLNVGVKPPGALECDRVAKLEAWLVPEEISKSPDEAGAAVMQALETQYERIIGRNAGRLKYRALLDPTSDKLLLQCSSLRDRARNNAILFHFNGHGVPSPSDRGELWTFNDDFSKYMPVSLFSLQECLSYPTVYVVDCNNAGIVRDFYLQFCDERETKERERLSAPPCNNPRCIYCRKDQQQQSSSSHGTGAMASSSMMSSNASSTSLSTMTSMTSSGSFDRRVCLYYVFVHFPVNRNRVDQSD
jgi:hypothetical protein